MNSVDIFCVTSSLFLFIQDQLLIQKICLENVALINTDDLHFCMLLQKAVEADRNEIFESPVVDDGNLVTDDAEAIAKTCDSQTQTEPCSTILSTADQGTQVGDFLSRPY